MIRPDRPLRLLRLASLLPSVALAVALAAPAAARGAADLVAEAAFLSDTIPPDGHALAVSQGGPELAPRAQLAVALGARLGLTVEAGVHRMDGGVAVDTPSASLKVLLREPGEDRAGLSLSLDLLGSAHDLSGSEAGAGLGVVRALGPLTARAALWGTSGVAEWSPHGHAGTSLAVEVRGVRFLAEAVSDFGGGPFALAAGPTVKVPLGARASLAAGALAPLVGGAAPSFFVQLARAL